MSSSELPCDFIQCNCIDKCAYLELHRNQIEPTTDAEHGFVDVTADAWDDGIDRIYFESEMIGEQ